MSKIDYKQYYETDAASREDEKNRKEIHVKFKHVILPMIKKMKKDWKFVDIGTGSGYMVGELRKLDYNVIGTDISEKMVKLAKADYGDYFKYDDITKSSFNDNEFDVSICTDTIEHVPDVDKTLSELKRITKKYIIISVPYKEEIILETCPHCLKKFHRSGHLHYFDIQILKKLADKHNLKIVKVKKTMAMPLIRFVFPFNIILNKIISIFDLSTSITILFKK